MKPTFSITNAITAALTRIERARGFLEAASLSKDWVLAMGERALVLEAHHTTHIEGTRLTLDQSERLMAGDTADAAAVAGHLAGCEACAAELLRLAAESVGRAGGDAIGG